MDKNPLLQSIPKVRLSLLPLGLVTSMGFYKNFSAANLRRALKSNLGLSVLLVLGTIFLLVFNFRPLTFLLIGNSDSEVVSDGGDSMVAGIHAREFQKSVRESPLVFFAPSIYTKKIDAPEGFKLSLSFLERSSFTIASFLVSPDQANGFFLHVLLLLNLVIFYLWGVSLGWSRLLSFLLAASYCCTPFVRARVVTHPALAGVFLFPLVFLVLSRLRRGARSLKAQIFTGFLILLIAGATPYFLLILFTLFPFVLFYYYVDSEAKAELPKISILFFIPAIFLIFLLGLGFKSVDSLPSVAPPELAEHFWLLYGASPIDYLRGSQIGMAVSRFFPELLPIENREVFNFTEHAHGQSLILLLLSSFAFLTLDRKKFLFWSGLALFAFWCSLGAEYYSPAQWLRFFIPEFRIANRFSPIVTLCFIYLAGSFLAKRLKEYPVLIVLPILALIEMSSLKSLETVVLPSKIVFTESCGTAIALPYISQTHNGLKLYQLYNSLRDTDCKIVNRSGYRDFPKDFLFSKQSLQCLGVDWIFNWSLDPRVCEEVGATAGVLGLCRMENYEKLGKSSLQCVQESPLIRQ